MAVSLTTPPGDVNLSLNPVYVKFQSSSYTLLDNYRVVLRVLFEKNYGSNTYDQIVEVEAIPDSNAETCFDISRILHTEIKQNADFLIPDLALPHPFELDTLRRFKLQYLEKYGTPQVAQTATTSSAYRVILGGVDAHYFGLYDFFSNISATNSLLTYFPSGKINPRTAPEVLTYIHHNISNVNYNRQYLKVTQYDVFGNAISTFNKYKTYTGSDQALQLLEHQSGVFPVGAAKLGISSNAVKYTVQVMGVPTIIGVGGEVDNGTAVAHSQEYAYYLDDTYAPPATLIWFGSFGNPHTLRCTGRKRTRLQIQRQISEQVVPYGYDPTTLATVQHRRDYNTLYSYRTGSLKPDEADALAEMLLENQLLEYAADGNYYRLILTENRYDLHETRITPNFLEFNAERALAPGNYMRLRAVASAEETGDSLWQENDNGFWTLNTGVGFWTLN